MSQKPISRRPTSRLPKAMTILIGALALLWIIHLVNFLLGYSLNEWGLRPRSLKGLVGIVTSPLLHAGWWHIISNTLPFLILGGLVLMRGLDNFLELTLFVAILGGAGVWLIGGGNELHVGASGVVFGYFGYLVARGIFLRDLVALGVSLLVMFLYGGLIFGVLPTRPYVSWEGHLCGLLAGVLAAWMELDVRRRKKKAEE